MILWILKQVRSVRRAVAGRKNPHQLAWAVALGLLLGLVPHGNLLAFALVILVLSLKINHAMAGLTALVATCFAVKLDPYAHELGNFVLTHPQLEQTTQLAWSLPLVPWTDLNNTIVMGSFLMGLTAAAPVFLVTYPLFRMVASTTGSKEKTDHKPPSKTSSHAQHNPHQVVLIDHGHMVPKQPKRDSMGQEKVHPEQKSSSTPNGAKPASNIVAGEPVDFVEIKPDEASEPQVAVETRIDVIRMTDHYGTEKDYAASEPKPDAPEPMDEALNYLLRQLRDSQQRKAA